jgi:hypothetical protein
MSTDRMSFDEACSELGISEAELEHIVAAGEIASIKEGDALLFKSDVVQKFKEQRDSEPSILLADDEINLLEDDVEEIDLLGDDEATTPVGVPGESAEKGDLIEISLDDDGGLPDLDLDADEPTVAADTDVVLVKGSGGGDDDTMLDMDGLLEEESESATPVLGAADDDGLLDTDLLDLAGDTDPFSADTAEGSELDDLAEQGALLRGGGPRVMQMKRKKSDAWWSLTLAAAAILLILPLGIMTNLVFTSSSEAAHDVSPAGAYTWITDSNVLQGAVETVADFWGDLFKVGG